MKTFNNTYGTTASEYSIGVGSAEARNIVLTAVCDSTDSEALDKQAMPIEVNGIAFYDMRVIAKNDLGQIAAKQLRGTINTAVTRIEDIFQEFFDKEECIFNFRVSSVNVNFTSIENKKANNQN